MDLERAQGILEWTKKPAECRVALSTNDRYVPAIFYQDVSEFGNQTTHSAEPYFPVSYLVVSVNGPTFPMEPNPLFTNKFPIGNRITGPQGPDQLKAHLNSPDNKAIRPTGQLKVVSDFHLLLYLAVQQGTVLGLEDEREGIAALCKAVRERDSGRVSEIMQKPSWLNMVAIISAGGGGEGGGGGRGAASSSGLREFGTVGGGGAPGGGAVEGRGGYDSEAGQLASMGFDKKKALEILTIVNGNMELAIEMLSST